MESGEFPLKSGNVLCWMKAGSGGSGSLTGCFRVDPPSAQDITEAQEFLRGKVPDGSETAFEKIGTLKDLERSAAKACQN